MYDPCDDEDEVGERLRLIVCDAKDLSAYDRSTIAAAASYVDWQDRQLRELRLIVRELQARREAQLDRVRELQRCRPVTINFFPAIVGSDCACYYGYGVRP